MGFKRFAFLILILVSFSGSSFAVETTKITSESDQQIGDFSLSGYGEKGKKSWDLSGKSADILDEVVKLKKVVGNHYTDNDSINLTADKGDFNKESGVVHLEDNVVITTSSGAKLTTDSLDWDRKQQIVSTLDRISLQRSDMNLTGEGVKGQTALKQMALEKNVRLDIDPSGKQNGRKEKIVVTCDGPLDVNYEKNIAIFNNNVKVEKSDLTIYSDKMEVYFTSGTRGVDKRQAHEAISSSIDRIVALGNVRIVRGENVSYSQEAVYTAADKRIVLTGKPHIEIYQTENMNAAFGN